ncbi:MAG: ribosome maturation factor RimM [Synechococcaceae cyanobacterium RM1_1_27]|nr:ribosome maturation factor RimM [Synechococcaceae cyanobacterium SM2_3_2]NJO85862.1 ribosome maturation factor RimM [Synechococcaceae cyanobacterium RM1_1_27]
MEEQHPYRVVGILVGAHGLQGWVRVKLLSDFPARLTQPGRRWIRPLQSGASASGSVSPIPMDLEAGHYLPTKDLYRVKLTQIPDRTAAEQWIGSEILVLGQDRPILAEEEYYLPDLIGMTVVHQQGRQPIGTVVGLITAGDDVLEVKAGNDKVALIPFVKALVPLVDMESRCLVVDPPPGLLEAFLDWDPPSD